MLLLEPLHSQSSFRSTLEAVMFGCSDQTRVAQASATENIVSFSKSPHLRVRRSLVNFQLVEDDDSQSSTASLIDKDGFQITYGDYSQVFGDYMSDNFQISSITIKDLEFAVARETSEGLIGVMGIGFDAGESIAYASGESYKNIMDSMVDQGLTNSRSYSLWLNDLGKLEENTRLS